MWFTHDHWLVKHTHTYRHTYRERTFLSLFHQFLLYTLNSIKKTLKIIDKKFIGVQIPRQLQSTYFKSKFLTGYLIRWLDVLVTLTKILLLWSFLTRHILNLVHNISSLITYISLEIKSFYYLIHLYNKL